MPQVKTLISGGKYDGLHARRTILSLHSPCNLYYGTVWAWGANSYGKLGDGTTTDRQLTPVQVRGEGGVGFLNNIIAISAGYEHTVALRNDGTVWAWGSNGNGRLGDNTTTDRLTPVQVRGEGAVGFIDNITAISAGNAHTVALRNDGTVWAWGSNVNGRLGDGTTTRRTTPVQVRGEGAVGFLNNITAISAGNGYTAALRNDGTVWAWGSNNYGQLGDGTTTNRHTPVQVRGEEAVGFLNNITAISAAGESHTVALRNDGTVWAWGRNYFGQLGDGTSGWDFNRYTPVQVRGVDGVGFLYLTPLPVNLTIDLGASIVISPPLTVAHGGSFTLPSYQFTREGHLFDGWVASGAVTGNFSPGDTITNITGDFTLAIIWLRIGAVATGGAGYVTSADIVHLARSVAKHDGFSLAENRIGNLRGIDRDPTPDDVTLMVRWLVGYDLKELIQQTLP